MVKEAEVDAAEVEAIVPTEVVVEDAAEEAVVEEDAEMIILLTLQQQ